MTLAEGERPGFDRGASLEGETPMTRITSSRPRMAASYAPGTVRARRWHGDGDVRGYRPRAGRPAPISPTLIPSRAAPCRVLCGGSSRQRNNRVQHRAQTVLSWARWTQNPVAAVAAPGVEGQQPNQNAASLAVAQVAALEVSAPEGGCHQPWQRL